MTNNTPVYKSLHPGGLYGAKNFVTAGTDDADEYQSTTALAVRPSPITSDQVTGVVGDMLAAYRNQQQQVLRVPASGHQVEQGGRSDLSTPQELAERRKTSGMYLVTYGLVAGATMAGAVYLLSRAVNLDTVQTGAMWLMLTGVAFGYMVWHRHGQELNLSKEGLAGKGMDLEYWLAERDADGRLALAQAMADSIRGDTSIRQRAADAEMVRAQASHTATAAKLVEARQVAAEQAAQRAERAQRAPVQFDGRIDWTAPDADDADDAAGGRRFKIVGGDDADGSGLPDVMQYLAQQDAVLPEPPASADAAVEVMAKWLAELYGDTRAIGASGAVKVRVPWSDRAEVPDDVKRRMLAMVKVRPQLFVAGDGGRWRVRQEVANNLDAALAWLDAVQHRC